MDCTVDFNISVKDINCWTSYTGNLFIVVEFYVGPATFPGWAENRRTLHQYSIAGIEFRVFPSSRLVGLPKLKSLIYYFTHS